LSLFDCVGALPVATGEDTDDLSEKMVSGGHTSDMERNDGTNDRIDASDFDSFENDFDDVVLRLANTMRTKPIRSQHRYVSSAIALD